MYKITLRGKEKKQYSVAFFGTWVYRRVLEIMPELNTDKVTVEDLDVISAFIVEVFDNQFTMDELERGMPKLELLETIGTIFSMVLYDMTEDEVKEAKSKIGETGDGEKE
jgi:hypothetical protein